MAAHLLVLGQQRVLTGTVTDVDNLPLPGVTVAVENTTKGTITDIDGNYRISLGEDENVLVFSFIGFDNVKVDVSGQSEVNVVMQDALLGLDEVVIVGYGTVRKSDLTGAVGRVGGDELNTMATADPVRNLQGKLSGVDVVSTG